MKASELHKTLLALGKQGVEKEMKIKEYEADLRSHFAELMDYTDKDGVNVKPSMVKMPLFKPALELVYNDAPDTKGDEYETYEKYVAKLRAEKKIKDASINAMVKRYLQAKDQLEAIKEEIKNAKSEAVTTEEGGVALEKEDVTKVEALVKVPVTQYKEKKEDELLEQMGKPPKKRKTIMTIEELIAFANANGIEVKLNG